MIKDILTIAKFTFVQVNKSKILVNVIFLSVAIALISYILAEFTHGVPSKIAIDIGFGLASISSVGIAIFLGVHLLSLEIESRTVYMIFSRPVSRFSFYAGKMLGMSMFLTMNTFLISLIAVAVYFKMGGERGEGIFLTILSICLESILTLFIVVFLAFIVNNIISVITTITLYIVGHGIEDAKTLTYVMSRPWLEKFVKFYSSIMPNFANLNLKRYLFYSRDLYPFSWEWVFSYGLLYILSIACVSYLIFRNKNLD